MTIHDPVTLAIWESVPHDDPDARLYPSGRRALTPAPENDPLQLNDLRIILARLERHPNVRRELNGELRRLARAVRALDAI